MVTTRDSLTARLGRAVTWLFVPGDRPERFDKAVAARPDVVVIDLEDGVGAEQKQAARRAAVRWLAETDTLAAVRINSAGPDLDADLRSLGGVPRMVMVPKAEQPDVLVETLEGLGEDSLVVALIETARGVLNASAIAAAPGVVRLAFGGFDLGAQLGVDPAHAPAMAASRGALVLASAAAGLAAPVDAISGGLRDLPEVTRDAREARALGFGGKLCIHPAQVPVAARAFQPSVEEVEWAQRIIRSQGSAVGVVRGELVDKPVLLRARRLLQEARLQAEAPDGPTEQ